MSKEPNKDKPQAEIAKQLLQYAQPQEKALAIKDHLSSLSIGIPAEDEESEFRVALRPEAVRLLVNNGNEVRIEAGAGKKCQYDDHAYSEAGAKVCYDPEEVFQSEIILKVAPPTLGEIEMIPPRKTLISALHLAGVTPEYLHALVRKKITAIAYEMIEDSEGGLPVVRAMSEIAGSTVILIAAEYLSSANGGQGIMLGGITGVAPTNVVILGAGTVGEYAARAALGLGANVQIFDNNTAMLRRLKYNLAQPHLFTSILDTETLQTALTQADVVIGAIRPEKGRTPCVVSEEMVARMKAGSVIVDVSIDHGGCIETSETTTHTHPTFKKYGVIHYCVPNIPSRVARTATSVLSNFFAPLLVRAGEMGSVEDLVFTDGYFSRGVYAYQGNLTNQYLSKKFNMRYKDLSLLVAAKGGFSS
ncbi:alanine dehydrogenase [Hugenholtzia roseola]|uniref:alanine dehydrogenase n=1 Tax=Hugenholtzia roseola TaxID=1002 RepID=UPI0003FC998E|nr:alanine dehydrogenase [Hugenholtzia roseola]